MQKPLTSAYLQGVYRATRPGFEPGQREPKSLVLPLHYRVVGPLIIAAAVPAAIGPATAPRLTSGPGGRRRRRAAFRRSRTRPTPGTAPPPRSPAPRPSVPAGAARPG